MTSYGMARRGSRSGLWRRTHDLGGTGWDLLLPMPRFMALHLLDAGLLCFRTEAPCRTLHPGIVITRDRIEARICLSRPETAFASVDREYGEMNSEDTPMPLSRLWSNDRNSLTSQTRRDP